MEQNYNEQQQQVALPNATAVLVLGILSIVCCCGYGIVGIIFGIIALVMANSPLRLYKEEPYRYTLSSYQNMNAGRICAIIGVVLSVLFLIYCIWIISAIGIDALTNPALMQERSQELFQQ